jgi:hypothetical protein
MAAPIVGIDNSFQRERDLRQALNLIDDDR